MSWNRDRKNRRLARELSQRATQYLRWKNSDSGNPEAPNYWQRQFVTIERWLNLFVNLLFGILVFLTSISIQWIATFGMFPSALFLVTGKLGLSEYDFLEIAGRLSVIGVTAGLFRLSVEHPLREEIKVYLPMADESIVGDYWIASAKVAWWVGVPCGIVFGAAVFQQRESMYQCLIAIASMSIATTFSIVSCNELIRRWIPWGKRPRYTCSTAALFVAVFLLADSIDPPQRGLELADFGSVWMSTAQCLPATGWFLATYLYVNNDISYFPVGSLFGMTIITLGMWITRRGFFIRGFYWNTQGRQLQVERLDHASQNHLWRSPTPPKIPKRKELLKKQVMDAIEGPLIAIEGIDAQALSPRTQRTLASLGLIGMLKPKGPDLAIWFYVPLFVGWNAYLLYLSQSQWLGSLSTVYLSIWILLSCLLSLHGKRLASSQYISFLEAYMPVRPLECMLRPWPSKRTTWLCWALQVASVSMLLLAGIPLLMAIFLASSSIAMSILHHLFFYFPYGIRTNDMRSVWTLGTMLIFIACCILAAGATIVVRTTPGIGLFVLWASVFVALCIVLLSQWLMERGWVDRHG